MVLLSAASVLVSPSWVSLRVHPCTNPLEFALTIVQVDEERLLIVTGSLALDSVSSEYTLSVRMYLILVG
jgi:hypothetical protein